MQSKSYMLTAKQIPRPTFNPNDPSATRDYIFKMARGLNCLAMISIKPREYYSVPETGLRKLREAKAPQFTPLPKDEYDEKHASSSSGPSDQTPTTTSSQSPKLSTSSSMYPSPQKNIFNSRPEEEISAEQLRALSALTPTYIGESPTENLATSILELEICKAMKFSRLWVHVATDTVEDGSDAEVRTFFWQCIIVGIPGI